MSDSKSKVYQSIPVIFEQEYKLDGKIIKNLTMRAPVTNDVINANESSSNEFSQDVHLFANLTDSSVEFIGQLAWFDYKKMEAANNCFLVPLSKHLELRALYLAEAAAE